ncbi:MAG: MBL fold metallo-hydrolase [Deltaproteobacteria bacterium]
MPFALIPDTAKAGGNAIMNVERKNNAKAAAGNPTITVLYDNNSYREDLSPGWGFSCLVRGEEKTILFDTGGDGAVLLDNMEKLGIDPGNIDIVVLSHAHGDHTGGLERLLTVNRHLTVFLLQSFPSEYKNGLRRLGIRFVEVHDFAKICKHVYSTGELGTLIKEQSLIIRTDQGIVVITGCAHPGIIEIINEAKRLMHVDTVLLAMGGFHLLGKSKQKLEDIVAAFKQSGVSSVGPCHCSGDLARHIFAEQYRQHYVEVGAGTVIHGAELP